MYIALRLLRDGAHTTITTRFPRDAARRFAAMPDSADWLDRLSIVGIDLRNPAQVVALADDVAAAGPARHPHQQRRPDRAPLRRRVRPARAGRGGGAAGRPAAADPHLRPGRRDQRPARPDDRAPRSAALDPHPPRAHHPRAHRRLRLARAHRRPDAPSTPAASSPTSTRSTAGSSTSRRSIPSSCSRSSSATRPRRSSSSAACAPRSPPPPPAARTSSTSPRSRASSTAATRAPATRTRTCPRPR